MESIWKIKITEVKAKREERKTKLWKIKKYLKKIWCASSKIIEENSNAEIIGRKKIIRIF